jgi:hypothetical protein
MPGLEYWHRYVFRRLSEEGPTPETVARIKQDVRAGIAQMVANDRRTGDQREIGPKVWAATETGAIMSWAGRAAMGESPGGDWDGDIYVCTEPGPPAAIPPDLGARERTTVYKLILGLAAGGYRYKPRKLGERTPVVPEIVADLERLGLSLSDETVRKWLTDAYEALGKPDLD